MLSSAVTLLSCLCVLVPVSTRMSSEPDIPLGPVDASYSSQLMYLVHEPNKQEVQINCISESVLQATKDLLSFSPRAARVGSVEDRLQDLRRMHPREAEELLRSRGVQVPPLRPPPNCENALHYRTMDGSCNNILRPCWGKADEPYQRWIAPVYANGIDSPRRRLDHKDLPSPRQVYQWVSSQQQQTANSTLHHLSSFAMTWGQMLAHDIILTPVVTIKTPDGQDNAPDCCMFSHPDCIPIFLNFEDGFYRHGHCINVIRSSAHAYNPQSCTPVLLGSQREQMNQLTSFVDASLVYGTSEAEMLKLREADGMGAMLKMDRWGCPVRKDRKCKSSHKVCDERCFDAGEKRANENPVLAAMHAVWVREHNRIATELGQRGWSNDTLFHVTRKVVGAIMQHITYSEYLPAILGPSLVDHLRLRAPTRGGYEYDATTNPGIFNAFAAAAFRFGHSMVDSRMVRRGIGYAASPLLSEDFFSVDEFCNIVDEDPLAPLLGGQADQKPQKVDCLFSKQITQHLFADRVNGIGMDLFSTNIQRGRDHGIPPYTAWREYCRLQPPVKDYSDLRHDIPEHILERIKAIYGPGGVHEIDLYVGGVAEVAVNGGILGRTFTCIIANQFASLKFGDRFWYENTKHPGALSEGQIAQIQKTTLAGLLCRNSLIRTVQRNAFQAESASNPKVPCEWILQETSLDFRFW